VRAPGIVRRLLIALLAAALALLLVEGATSLVTGESLFARWTDPLSGLAPDRHAVATDEDRARLAALTEGAYAQAIDPHVGFVLKPSGAQTVAGVTVTLDAYGQRERIGPPPEADACRIVVLGDSVAFGFGLRDDETLAQRLEELLAATMAPGAPRPFVTTVACPGWNLHNSTRFLRNHLARIAPDVVLFLPTANDLHDSFDVNEAGHRLGGLDPRFGATAVHVSTEEHAARMRLYRGRLPRALGLRIAAAGGVDSLLHVTQSGITPESRRRWAAAADDLQALRRSLDPDDELAVVLFWSGPGAGLVLHMLGERMPDLPMIGTFRGKREGDTLVGDPHPSATFVRAAAWCLADELVERGWVPGAGARPLPELDPAFAQRRWRPEATRAETRAEYEAAREQWRSLIGPTIDTTTGVGFHQIYGGLVNEKTVGRGLLVALENPGAPTLKITVGRPPASSRIYPLDLTFTFNGRAASRVALPPPDGEERSITLSVDVPPELRGEELLDVGIEPSNWIVRKVGHVSRVTSFDLERVTLD